MGGFARCCCAGCDCLPVEDLPTVTISGYTGGGWSGTCCYEQTFTPNVTPSWTKSCSSMIYESAVTEQCVTEHWRLLAPDYRGFEFFTGTDCANLSEDYCCPEGFEKIATTTTDWTFTDNAFMAVWRRIKEIRVRISREEVDCTGIEGQESGCKIVIRSRTVYDYSLTYYRNQLSTYAQSVTMHNTDCFEVDPDYEITADTPTAITCSDVPASPPAGGIGGDGCLTSGTFFFDRVRYYDDMPTGSVSFGNSDIPGCIANGCDYSPWNYASSVCIYSPSSPIATMSCYLNEPCYCTDDVFASNNTIGYGPIICGGDNVFISSVSGCNDEPCELCTTLITECDGLDIYECPDSTWSTACLQYDIEPENEATCFRTGIGGGEYNACFCANSIEGVGEAPSPYIRSVFCNDPTNCNADCCRSYNEDCPCCFPDGICKPYHSTGYFASIYSHTRSQTCSGFQSQSICTSAPTWTITLS
jgi:hypothetical protein